MPDHAKEYSSDVIEFTMRANESCFDKFTNLQLCRYPCGGALRLAQMNAFSHYCLTFGANDRIFPLNEQ